MGGPEPDIVGLKWPKSPILSLIGLKSPIQKWLPLSVVRSHRSSHIPPYDAVGPLSEHFAFSASASPTAAPPLFPFPLMHSGLTCGTHCNLFGDRFLQSPMLTASAVNPSLKLSFLRSSGRSSIHSRWERECTLCRVSLFMLLFQIEKLV
ncbi:hypothetical protein SLA2020_462400 [Shorea laevis]